MIKDKFNRSGKEQYRQLDTPKTEEKTTTVNTEGNKSEAPKKKKNIIRVFHAQNASDGGERKKKTGRRARERDRHVHRTAVREAQEQTQETVRPVSRETVRVDRIALRAEERRQPSGRKKRRKS